LARKVGGIKAARLTTGLETGTGEAEVANENCLPNTQSREEQMKC